jgi:hypothetical protein
LKRFHANQLRLAVLASLNLEQVCGGRQTLPCLPIELLLFRDRTSSGKQILLLGRSLGCLRTLFGRHRFAVFGVFTIIRGQILENGSTLLFPLWLALKLQRMTEASLDQFGGTSMQDDLKKTFRFLLQSGAASALCLTKLNSTFLALLGGELRHLVLVIIYLAKPKSSAFD